MYFPFCLQVFTGKWVWGLVPRTHFEVVPFRTLENALLKNIMYLFSSLIFKG